MKRCGYTVGGQVQGVGFRPFVFRTAERLGLSGLVGNTSEGVRIEVQGDDTALDAFDRALQQDLPVLARIVSCTQEALPVQTKEEGFHIMASQGHHGHAVLVSPDVATCTHCLADMDDPANRRHHYPFTNCTDCGPRYTITQSIPYDRSTTSMNCFPLCPECQAEYDNPRDRRFHAQPNACPICGPKIWLTDGTVPLQPVTSNATTVIEQTTAALIEGKIVAIKGLGGFHLVCDATNEKTLATLRQRKRRPHKSLAVMVPDLETVRRIALLAEASLEETALLSPERPIVVLPALPGVLPRAIAPDLDSTGIMLPYTPLHYLLLKNFRRPLRALVMTSGNAGGEPIALGNREALVRLQGIADLFLLHNRDILIRADDSVLGPAPAESMPLHVFRRARGYVPRPLPLPPCSEKAPCVLAVGAELKNTLCLTRGNDAFVSQHIGDLKNLETFAFFRNMASHLSALLEVRPEALVCDLHPDYLSTAFALENATNGLPLLRIQHHFAHIYSVLGEHEHLDPALGLALDGTGYGPDGTIWGGELLFVHPQSVRGTARQEKSNSLALPWGERLGRLAPFPLPGGEAAIREPWRLASGFLGVLEQQGELPESASSVDTFFPDAEIPAHTRSLHKTILELVRQPATLRTSSCGRLFDAVAALLGLCPVISYEGQAAIRLERVAAQTPPQTLPPVPVVRRDGLWELDTAALFLHLLKAKSHDASVPALASGFHFGLAEGLAELALQGAHDCGIRTVALSGGVLHNRLLARALPEALRRRGLTPLTHQALPPGDGCIAFGQAFWARLALETLPVRRS